MFFHNRLEDKIASLEKRTKELILENEGLDRNVESLLTELKVTPEQLKVYLADPKHFNDQNWEELQSEKSRLDQKLKETLDQRFDPLAASKSYRDRKVVGREGQHWIFVR